MTTLLFVAEVTQEGAGYHAALPDLPGLSVQASDLSALLVAARHSVSARLQSLSDTGEAWPADYDHPGAHGQPLAPS